MAVSGMTGRLFVEGQTITVDCDGDGRPLAFTWQGYAFDVTEICQRYRVSEQWWNSADYAWREYIKVGGVQTATAQKLLCLIAHSLDTDQWHLIRTLA